MTYPPQPGQEGYGQGTGEYGQGGPETQSDATGYRDVESQGGAEGQSGAVGNGSPYWAGNPQGALGPGAYVPPQDPPVFPYPSATYPPPGVNYPTPGYPASGYPVPGYPTPGYGYGAPYGYLGQYPQSRPTDGMAIASLVVSCAAALSLCAWGIGGVLLGIPGAIFGHVAKRRIRNSGAGGDGLALAGIIVGWITTGIGLLLAGLLVTLIVMDSTTTTY